VLDVCCGYGRHALELGRRGRRVTGIDLAPAQIEFARRRAEAAGIQPAQFVQGDVRTMQFAEPFDACLNLFTSFGFFDDDGNQEMLARIAQATRADG
jgi:ubiquinone/menaquinone biosynthesis C-methylase UbiE